MVTAAQKTILIGSDILFQFAGAVADGERIFGALQDHIEEFRSHPQDGWNFLSSIPNQCAFSISYFDGNGIYFFRNERIMSAKIGENEFFYSGTGSQTFEQNAGLFDYPKPDVDQKLATKITQFFRLKQAYIMGEGNYDADHRTQATGFWFELAYFSGSGFKKMPFTVYFCEVDEYNVVVPNKITYSQYHDKWLIITEYSFKNNRVTNMNIAPAFHDSYRGPPFDTISIFENTYYRMHVVSDYKNMNMILHYGDEQELVFQRHGSKALSFETTDSFKTKILDPMSTGQAKPVERHPFKD